MANIVRFVVNICDMLLSRRVILTLRHIAIYIAKSGPLCFLSVTLTNVCQF